MSKAAKLTGINFVFDKSHWVFERSSGYAGWRCTRCATWIYANQEKKCKCNEKGK